MANQQIVSYLKENSSKGYSLDSLKEQLRKQGFSDAQISEASVEAGIVSQPAPQVAVIPADEGLSPDTEKILAALSYPFWIAALVTILIAKPKNKYAKYHGFQGLFWGIAIVVVYIAFQIFINVLSYVPFLGWAISILLFLTAGVFWLLILVIDIIFAVQAYQGKAFKIPVIYGMIPADAKY